MANLLRMFAGAMVWAAHFLLLYGFTTLACARGMVHPLPYALGGGTLAALATLAAIVIRAYRQRAHFAAWMTIAIACMAFVAVVFESIAFMVVPACR